MNTRRRLTLKNRYLGRNSIRRDLEVYTQQPDVPKLESLIGMIMEYLSSINIDKAESETKVFWMGGTF